MFMVINQLDYLANYIPIESGTLTFEDGNGSNGLPSSSSNKISRFTPDKDAIIMFVVNTTDSFDENAGNVYILFSHDTLFENYILNPKANNIYIINAKKSKRLDCIIQKTASESYISSVSYYYLIKTDIKNNILNK